MQDLLMREYYIRKEGDEEASGPYNLDQITSLIEAGKLDKEAFVYDIDTESWIQIEDCAELMEVIYPQKDKLTLQVEPEPTEEELAAEEKANKKKGKKKDEEEKGITVAAMLAQAEGREGDDASGRSPVEKRALSAFVGLRFTTLFLFGAAAAMIALEWDIVKSANAMIMMGSPYVVFAAFDILFGLVLLLQVTEIYPLIRFRAAIGLGTLSMLFLTSGDHLLALANAVLSISIYFCTATLSTPKVIPFCILGILSLGGYIALVILPLFS